jgi:hypothetical protein
MVESRRRLLTTLGVAAGFAAAGQFTTSLFAQNPTPQPRPSANAPQNQNAPMGLEHTPAGTAPRQSDINRQMQAALRAEVDKLCAMANELKEDMLHANPSETLSLTFVKKAQAIEKLAKQIKDQAKG